MGNHNKTESCYRDKGTGMVVMNGEDVYIAYEGGTKVRHVNVQFKKNCPPD